MGSISIPRFPCGHPWVRGQREYTVRTPIRRIGCVSSPSAPPPTPPPFRGSYEPRWFDTRSLRDDVVPPPPSPGQLFRRETGRRELGMLGFLASLPRLPWCHPSSSGSNSASRRCGAERKRRTRGGGEQGGEGGRQGGGKREVVGTCRCTASGSSCKHR